MAFPPIYIIGAGLGLLLASRKRKSETTSSSTPKDQKPVETQDENKSEESEPPNDSEEDQDQGEDLPPPPKDNPKLPPVDFPDNLNIPKSEDSDPDAPNINVNIIFDKFYQAWNQSGNETPSDPSVDKIWISNSCKSWGIGKNWQPYLPAKYVFTENDLQNKKLDPNDAISPIEYIKLIPGSMSPDPVYVYNFPGDMIYYQWARNIIDLYSDCGAVIPKRSNYAKFKLYEDALKDFVQTPIGKLFLYLSENIRIAMYDQWAILYPAKADEENLKGWSLWAVRNFPKYSYSEQTDEAYKKVFENDPNAPKKINPKLASHIPYQKAWVNISQWVKDYRALIPIYG